MAILKFLGSILKRPSATAAGPQQRAKLHFDTMPDVVYAIGDVHGCLSLLQRLEEIIERDAEGEEGKKVLVRLGDYVDRGPESAAVLDRLSARSKLPFDTLNLAGNHEEVMLDFLLKPHPQHQWLRFGGLETLNSYGIYKIPGHARDLETVLRAHVPDEHIDFLGKLPSLVHFPDLCLVHGGVDAKRDLDAQKDDVLLWKRPSGDVENYPFLLVHGHTPVEKVEIVGTRVNVDTGAYATGLLSGVKVRKTGEISVLSCN